MRPLIQLCKTSVSLTHRMLGLDALTHLLNKIFSPDVGIVGFYCRLIVIISSLTLCVILLAIVLVNTFEHP